jgi:DNA-binding winged helix-turn-helix (wHTH) protein/tetratricopeptide (TPR) repeat protein
MAQTMQEGARMRASQCLVFGPFRLDLRDERLWRGPEVVRLHPKSFAVLCCLVTQAGQLVTKEALLATVWPETVVQESVLTVAVRQLRRVLGDRARLPQFIETVHGRGYRFIAPVSAPVASREPVAVVEAPRLSRLPFFSRPLHFVGRDTELARLAQWWTTARQGTRQIGVIAGEPGIGKTSLVAAFLARAAAGEDLTVGHGQCIEPYGAGEPYLPVLEALGRLGQGPDGGELVALLRQYAPSWLVHLPGLLTPAEREALGRTTDSVTPTRMLRELTEALDVLTATRPLVLVLEDLHWSDHATLAWLAYVARRPDPARLLILGTYRPVEVIVEAHPLRRMITELQQHGQCTEMVLDYLSEAAVAAYLEQRFGAMPRLTGLGRVLHRYTHGNPLFLWEVVEEAVAQRLLEDTPEGWRLRAGSEAITRIVPESLRRLIEQQLEQLAPDEQALLEAASVTGSTFTAAAVAAGVAQPEEPIDARCATWARHGWFVHAEGTETWPDGTVTTRYSFRHALYHEVVYQRVAAGHRVRLHRRIGLRMEAGYGAQAPTMATALAMHFTRAQDLQRAVQYLRHAGEQALQRAAYLEAVACFEQALQVLKNLPEQRDTREQALDLRLALRSALGLSGDYRRALAHLREAEALAATLDDPRRMGQVSALLFHYFYIMGAHPQAITAAQRTLALATSSGDGGLHALAHLSLGMASWAQGDYRRAIACLTQTVASLDGVRRHERFGHSILPAVASRAYLTACHAELGTFAEGRALGDAGLQIAEAVEHAASIAFASWGTGLLALRQGDLPRALSQLERALSICQDADLPFYFSWVAAALGAAYTLSGRVADARPLLTQAMEQTTAMGVGLLQGLCGLSLGAAQLVAGCIDEARTQTEHVLVLARERQERGVEAWALRLLGAIASHSAHPQVEAARTVLQQALTLAETLGMRPLQAHCHCDLGLLYATTGQRQQARLALGTAMALYRSMDMAFWLPETEAALAQVEGSP